MTVEDLIEPKGELGESLFPSGDLEEFVAAYLADAEARTSSEAAQRAWVYHRAYSSVANRLHAGLASEKKGDASAALASDQFRYWQAKAAQALADFNASAGLSPGPILTRVRL